MWNTDAFGWQESTDPLYKDIPFFIATRQGAAYGLFLDNTYRTSFDFGKESRDSYSFGADGGELDYYFIYGPEPKRVVEDFTALVGRTPLPPLFALGYQQCRYSYYPEARVREIAEEFRKRKIPADVIYLDIDYQQDNRPFTIDRERFPTFEAMVEDLKNEGFQLVVITDLHLAKLPGSKPYEEGVAGDYLVKNPDGSVYVGKAWPGDSVFPDFTREAVRRWWGSLYADFVTSGVRGFWNDMNEPAIFERADKTMPLDTVHRVEGRKTDHREIHNVFGMQNARATYEGMLELRPDLRPFVLTRAAYAGTERYAATWTGDNASTWDFLKMAVPMTLNLGLSGQPFNGPDLGGFAGNPTPELWGQWVAMGVFFPFCRGHAVKGSVDKEPWAFGPEVESAARIALDRRYRLLPYIYTLFYQSSLDGSPVMDPVFFADIRDAALRAEDQAFLLGEDMLVVPRWADHPHLPGGIWRSVSLVEGDRGDKYQVDLKVRGGAIVPLGRVIQNTTEESLDPLTLLVSLDSRGRASGRLFEDAGDGYGYEDGDYLLTSYQAETRGETVVVTTERAEGRRPRPNRTIVIEIVTESGTFRGSGIDGQPIIVPLHQVRT